MNFSWYSWLIFMSICTEFRIKFDFGSSGSSLFFAIFFWSDLEYIQVQFTVNFDGFHAHFFGVLFHSLPFSSFDQHQIQSNRSQFEFYLLINCWLFFFFFLVGIGEYFTVSFRYFQLYSVSRWFTLQAILSRRLITTER